MKEIKIALVGQPNVGKSHLINSISGATLHVGNFSGVTVEKKEVEFERGGVKLKLIDLPGTYSFHAYTPEEEVTKKFLLNEEYDLILNVVDSNQLEKNLTFTWQLADLQKPMVVAFNMYDEFARGGGEIDTDRFYKLTNIMAQNVSAKENFGLEELFEKVIKTYELKNTPKVYYSELVEEQVENLKKVVKECRFSKRFIAIRLLEDDEDVYKIVHEKVWFSDLLPVLKKAKDILRGEYDEEDTKTILFEERYALSKGMVTQIAKRPKKETLTEKIDKILIHPILGLPLFLLIMWAIFQATFSLGAIPMDYIGKGFESFANYIGSLLPSGIVKDAITQGVIPAVGAVVMFLPNILILFLGINLLEQTGYMARAAYVMDGVLKRFGLQGRAFIPLVTGFGCSVPAYMAARTLKNPKDRLITMLVIGFMSCGARLPVYVLLVSAFFPKEIQGNVMFAIYIGGALTGLVVAKVLRAVLFKGEPEPFVMELPKYRFPKLKSLLFDLWIKTKLYLQKAGTFIAVASLLIWVLSSFPRAEIIKKYENMPQTPQLQAKMHKEILENSYLARIGKLMEPITKPLDLGWREDVSLMAGLAAKENIVSTMAVLYGNGSSNSKTLIENIKKSLPFTAAVAMIIVIMFYSPCLAAMSTFWAEVPQWAWRLFYTVYPNVFAYFAALLAVSLIKLFGA
ncbi:ferrous iron transport protein B [Caminibacter pacificus]|uniref:Ferrous iron transport protein B n=1 Tax=Caminibacter pacificus TaxID=1424653 RepID=A0AAJ4RBU3_9BACT|nr:ferrous iron transport protein B [Caminibacter pacificus]QCI28846.1 ferrous iron transport protein B [Caminibacter pacificus]ROR39435.1 ferrous iron transport protein B [Caminibacter pacificus]